MPTRSSRTDEAPARLLAGTSGWSYDEWKGPFYPEDLSSRDMLRFYAGRLPAVEVNNTFYRMPKPSVLTGWASQVPESFRFALKASRRITHIKRLKDAADETLYFLETAAALGPRLGALLFQLPPNLKLDLDRLDAFLALLPEGTRAAFEFRHESWANPAVFERLRARSFAWVIADVEDAPPPAFVITGSWTYLRLRRPDYTAADLARWVESLKTGEAGEALVFFKHEDEGAGPQLAAEFLSLAGAVPLKAGAAAAARETGRSSA